MQTQGVHHVGLTVKDVKQTAQFFVDILNFNVVREKPDYPAIFVSDGTHMITLWQVQDRENMNTFDRKTNIGLHHIAFKVESPEVLQSIYKTLNDNDVTIEFAPESVGEGPAQHMIFYEPGGIRIEIFTA